MPFIYDELHHLASSYLRGERPGHTLQPTALVNEVYLRLAAQQMPEWESRSQFFGIAARLMRQVLLDHARKHLAGKRGEGQRPISLDQDVDLVYSSDRAADFVAMDDALRELSAFDSRKARAIELRYFAGLGLDEIPMTPNLGDLDGALASLDKAGAIWTRLLREKPKHPEVLSALAGNETLISAILSHKGKAKESVQHSQKA